MAANHLRLYMDRDRVTAPQFKLRTGGGTKKGEELTEDARANLLIEMGACRGDRHEEELVCKPGGGTARWGPEAHKGGRFGRSGRRAVIKRRGIVE